MSFVHGQIPGKKRRGIRREAVKYSYIRIKKKSEAIGLRGIRAWGFGWACKKSAAAPRRAQGPQGRAGGEGGRGMGGRPGVSDPARDGRITTPILLRSHHAGRPIYTFLLELPTRRSERLPSA